MANVFAHPGVLKALSPFYGIGFLINNSGHRDRRWAPLAVLSVTGAEALYADMGHFGVTRPP